MSSLEVTPWVVGPAGPGADVTAGWGPLVDAH